MPTLEKAFDDFMAANLNRATGTDRLYRDEFARHFADWYERPLDDILRRDVEALFNRLTEDSGWSPANRPVSLLRSIYRRPCVDRGLGRGAFSWSCLFRWPSGTPLPAWKARPCSFICRRPSPPAASSSTNASGTPVNTAST